MKTKILIMLALYLGSAPGWAQEPSASSAKKQFPLEMSFINHAVTMPFAAIVLKPIHPGFNLGTEYAYAQGRWGRFFQSLQAGYYYNKYNAKALFLLTGAGFRYRLPFGLLGDAGLGVGYLHSFHPTEVFAQDASGEYARIRDTGKPAFVAFMSLGLGMDLSNLTGWPVCLFVRYQPYIQTPYSPTSSIFPQALFHFGVRVQLW